jgi:ABC-type polysaccharide/polyol phosphate transport system ATPase subunit
MSDIAISIENLGKRYRYGGAAPLSANLRSDLTEWAKGLIRRRGSRDEGRESMPSTIHTPPSSPVASVPPVPSVVNNPSPSSLIPHPSSLITPPTSPSSLIPHHSSLKEIHEDRLAHDPSYFWALRDINLEVRTGEVVGIIGRNGAGKSTLLKILSRITPPTTGKITYNGRIASLLEVGTGFHRELTGRENIFLNGSVLGMKRAEITKKFDEIVAFAEVDKFIDTPVKFYSSGMYVRLAFAVAAHLEPEILVVDEVLAVGDAEFQKKCLGKMGDVARQGRTVLFVSHNMGAIQALCSRCILVHQGALMVDDSPSHTITKYLSKVLPLAMQGTPLAQ